MSKNYANTALRLGYALASANLVSKLRDIQPDWSVNSLAQKAGISSLEDNEYLDNARKVVYSARHYLKTALTRQAMLVVGVTSTMQCLAGPGA